jgi:hypothetical protein
MAPHTPTISLSGSIAADARPGCVVVARWLLVNNSALPVAANVYLRTAPAPLAGLACRGGRTQVGRFHGGILVALAPGSEATIVAVVGPVEDGELCVRATAVTDVEEAAADLVTRVSRSGRAAPAV